MHANGIKTGSPKLKNTYWYPPKKKHTRKKHGSPEHSSKYIPGI